jgi:aryl-alcohol dehydrogenase-like predicted oxidoreductase
VEQVRVGTLAGTRLGLGCNTFGRGLAEDRAKPILDAAVDCGIRWLDTADICPPPSPGASETVLGNIMGSHRDKVVLATKFGWNFEGEHGKGGDAKFIASSLEASLRRLRTDWIDLYQLHRPDPETPIGETIAGMAAHIDSGKVREIGCSNFSAAQLTEALKVADEFGLPAFVSVQNEYSVLRPHRAAEVVPICADRGLAMIPYFPVAGGLLTGKYRRGQMPERTRLTKSSWGGKFLPERQLDAVEALTAYAAQHGRSILDLALGWVASQPGVGVVLTGATSPEQIRANAESIGTWTMTPEQVVMAEQIAYNASPEDLRHRP